jgi:molecular chaperone DnaK (HSP70)
LLQRVFPEHTPILAPSTSANAINPSHLTARGAAIQASLIQEFEKEDIEQSIHPMVTVTPHLTNAVGVQLVSTDDGDSAAVFRPLVNAETALPVRRIAQYTVPRGGGDILIRICEGTREIQVTKPEPKPRAEKQANGEDEDDDDTDFDADSDDDPEEIRKIEWKVLRPMAEIAVKDVKAGGKVEVTININSDLAMQLAARAVGARGGVRLAIEAPNATENGFA